VKQFRVKQRLDVVFTVQAETEQEAAALLRKQIEGVVELEAFNAESNVKRILEAGDGK
jgi:hypothetical protein